MTFRGRLVLATTAAVLVVVIMGSIATYLVAYNSLIGSADANLAGVVPANIAAQSGVRILNSCSSPGVCSQVVYNSMDGKTNPDDPTVLPVSPEAARSAASGGKAPNVYFSTTAGGIDLRELVVALPPGFVYRGNNGTWQLDSRRCAADHHAAHRREPGAPSPGLRTVDHRHRRCGHRRRPRSGRGAHRAASPEQPDRDGGGAGRDHRHVQATGPGRPRRARAAAPRLQPSAGGPRHLPREPAAAGPGRLPRAAHSADQPADQHGGGPPARGAGSRRARGPHQRRHHPDGRAGRTGGRHGRTGPRGAARAHRRSGPPRPDRAGGRGRGHHPRTEPRR